MIIFLKPLGYVHFISIIYIDNTIALRKQLYSRLMIINILEIAKEIQQDSIKFYKTIHFSQNESHFQFCFWI